MTHRYDNQGYRTQGYDRPRDEYGRFESESGQHRGGYDRPRDEYGRFESEAGQHRSSYEHRGSYDRPRDEYGRFESESSRYAGGLERPRDENGRFESESGQYARGWERPRDEYGRFESEADYRGQRQGSRRGPNGYSSQAEGRFAYDQGYGQSRGEHAGKGPKGYKRSDERIQEDVSEALEQNAHIDASEIEVKVNSGEVVLSGTVTDRQFKRLAEDLAERCSGVRDVRNEIRVQRENQTNGESQQHGRGKTASGTGNSNRQEAKTA